MTITKGFWRTRDGRKAEAVDVRNGIAIGWIDSTPFCWNEKGTTREPFNCTTDLIEPWIDAPIFNHWDKVPWAKCVFRNNDMWYALSEIISSPNAWVIDRAKYPYAIWTPLREEHYPVFTGPDKDSLILRPENV